MAGAVRDRIKKRSWNTASCLSIHGSRTGCTDGLKSIKLLNLLPDLRWASLPVDSTKQIAVRSGSFQPDMAAIFCERVNQNPVRLKMAVPTSRKFAAHRVVFVLWRQRLPLNQKIEDRFQPGQILAAFTRESDIFLELLGPAEGSHRPRSA